MSTLSLRDKAWSPYGAGIVIGPAADLRLSHHRDRTRLAILLAFPQIMLLIPQGMIK
ncbi:MAG TPA: hypothetical protein VEM36_09345 [Xanthobacteraceae bacterium]|nr:hypothetical protein [Xanthobacteraceae bacterium]